jgi:hypothetical protein
VPLRNAWEYQLLLEWTTQKKYPIRTEQFRGRSKGMLPEYPAQLRRITRKVPGLVGSPDDLKLARLTHHKLHLHHVQDLACRYKYSR